MCGKLGGYSLLCHDALVRGSVAPSSGSSGVITSFNGRVLTPSIIEEEQEGSLEANIRTAGATAGAWDYAVRNSAADRGGIASHIRPRAENDIAGARRPQQSTSPQSPCQLQRAVIERGGTQSERTAGIRVLQTFLLGNIHYYSILSFRIANGI